MCVENALEKEKRDIVGNVHHAKLFYITHQKYPWQTPFVIKDCVMYVEIPGPAIHFLERRIPRNTKIPYALYQHSQWHLGLVEHFTTQRLVNISTPRYQNTDGAVDMQKTVVR